DDRDTATTEARRRQRHGDDRDTAKTEMTAMTEMTAIRRYGDTAIRRYGDDRDTAMTESMDYLRGATTRCRGRAPTADLPRRNLLARNCPCPAALPRWMAWACSPRCSMC